ncbi:DUF1735 domain-containing protein [Bacteroides sp.]|uniref:BT_3987 domain-containing protein n=1 Tax=Bacteroides sp. TaxID=29523 RepID=UPI002FCA51A6
MENMKNIPCLIIMFIASMLYSSCSDDDFGSAPCVYMRSHYNLITVNYQYTIDGNIKTDLPDLKLSVNLTKEAVSPVTVKLAIDPSLLEVYNKENKTDFILFPEDALAFDDINIPVGEITTYKTIAIKHEKLKQGQQYLLPIAITTASADGQEITISTNTNRVFIQFVTLSTIANIEPVLGNLTGSFIDRKKWMVSASDVYSDAYSPAYVIDNDPETSWRGEKRTNSIFTIDMNEVKPVKGIHILSMFKDEYRYSPKIMSIKTSVDGKEWVSYGNTPDLPKLEWNEVDTPKVNVIKFVYPKPVRYVELKVEEHWSSFHGAGFTELNLIE